jgi:hypothetical protein
MTKEHHHDLYADAAEQARADLQPHERAPHLLFSCSIGYDVPSPHHAVGEHHGAAVFITLEQRRCKNTLD